MLDTKAIAAAMAPVVKDHVASAVLAATAPLLERIKVLEGLAPQKGDPGADGRDGADGKDGAPPSAEQIEKAVAEWLAANPPAAGKDGADGRDGADGKDGAPGERGADGQNGADGVSLAGALIDRDGELNVTLSTGEVRKLGPVVGRDGKDGERGVDGFSLEDFDVNLKADGRTVELSFARGDLSFVRELALPTMIYRGAYAEGASYEQGDTVTWAGSLWHCNGGEKNGQWSGATTEKPGDGSKAWTLAAKRGRDGKDFAGPQVKVAEKVKI